MKISVSRQNNKVNIKLIRDNSIEVEFLSTVASAEALVTKIQKVMSEIDGKNRNQSSKNDFANLFGDLWKK